MEETTLKYQLYSDLHLEFTNIFPRLTPIADILILAGDIGKVTTRLYKEFIIYCSLNWRHVIVVLGNHEFYINHSMTSIKNSYFKFFDKFDNVHLLDGTYFKIDNTVIYGFTAWTKSIFNSKTIAQQYLNDYNRIKTTKGAITPGFINELSTHEINQFREFTEKVNNGEIECENVIVVTHFPPISSNTSSPEYENGILSGYYSWTNLLKYEDVKCDKIKIWCSGHTHWSYDFKKSGVRYLSNQIGYPGENIAFNADLVFTL